jgi:hypothetical protein
LTNVITRRSQRRFFVIFETVQTMVADDHAAFAVVHDELFESGSSVHVETRVRMNCVAKLEFLFNRPLL